MLEAHVQTRFPFLGKERVPGDILSAEELEQCSPQTRGALVSQGHIVLKSADGEGGAGIDPLEAIRLAKRVDELEASNADLAQRLSAAEAALNKPSDALIDAIVSTAKAAVQSAVAESIADAAAPKAPPAPPAPQAIEASTETPRAPRKGAAKKEA